MWSHVGAALAASLADEPRFNIGKPHVVRPPIRRHLSIHRCIAARHFIVIDVCL
jgi:hypothetical protein